MKTRLAVAGILLLSMAGCAVMTHFVQDDAQVYEPTVAAEVKLYSSADLNVPYKVIGSVVVDVVGDGEAAKSALQQEASKIGANAVIGVTLTKVNTFASRTGLSGVAVRIVPRT